MLKLPKGLLTLPNVSEIERLFEHKLRYLYSEGHLKVPQWTYNEALRRSLKQTFASEHLIQGLEGISEHLDLELKGLNALKKLPGQTQNKRLSRLILLSNDGSERFYHNAESIVTKHADRAAVCMIDCTSDELGSDVSKKSTPVKALMISERKALELFLAQLV
jgi:hypothetical protein